MPKMPDAEVLLHGLLIGWVEKTDFESGDVTGHRATVVGAGGGAAIVNFDLKTPLPFAPVMSQVVWRVQSAPWAMDGNGSGMSTKFLGLVDEAHLMELAEIIRVSAAAHPDKQTAK